MSVKRFNSAPLGTGITYYKEGDAEGIRGVSLSTVGPAKGHGVWLDEEFVSAVAHQALAMQGGLKVRFGHPGYTDPVGTEIGYITNVAHAGAKATGDLVFIETAHNATQIDHVRQFAQKAPHLIGLSIEFRYGNERPANNEYGLPHETLEELLAIAITSDPAANPDGLFTANPLNPKMKHATVAMFMKLLSRLKTFAEFFTPEGVRLQTPGDTPEVGDPLVVLNEAGEVIGPAPAGEHRVQGTDMVLVVDGEGMITEVRNSPPEENAEDAAAEMAAKLEAVHKLLAEQAEQLKQLTAAAAAEKEASDKAAAATKTTPVKPVTFTMPRVATGNRESEIVRGFRKIAQTQADLMHLARQGDTAELERYKRTLKPVRARVQENLTPEQFAASLGLVKDYGKKADGVRAYSTGVAFDDDIVYLNPEVLREIFFVQREIWETISAFGTVHRSPLLGSRSSYQIQLPNMKQRDGQRLNPGVGCSYEEGPVTDFNARTLTSKPYNYFQKFCPADFGTIFNSELFVSDTQLPLQSVLLMYLMDGVMQDIDQQMMVGDTASGDLIDGLWTISQADTDIPGAQDITLAAINSTSALTEFAKMATAIANMRSLLAGTRGQEEVQWFTNYADLDAYFQNYRATFGALPYNTEFQKASYETSLFRNRFLRNGWLATQQMFASPKANLHAYMSDDLAPVIDFFDKGSERYLWIRAEGHFGVQYALSEKVATARAA